MGCCALQETHIPLLDPSASHQPTDPYALELDRYISDLLDSTLWQRHVDVQTVTISSLTGSRYSENVPVFSLRIRNLPAIDLNYGVKVLVDPEVRPQWDYLFSQYRAVDIPGRHVYYSLYEFPFPFKHRDLVETVSILVKPMSASVIKYSTSECEVDSGQERATMLFFVARLNIVGNTLEMGITAQLDIHVPGVPLFKKQIAEGLGEWAQAMREFIEENAAQHPYYASTPTQDLEFQESLSRFKKALLRTVVYQRDNASPSEDDQPSLIESEAQSNGMSEDWLLGDSLPSLDPANVKKKGGVQVSASPIQTSPRRQHSNVKVEVNPACSNCQCLLSTLRQVQTQAENQQRVIAAYEATKIIENEEIARLKQQLSSLQILHQTSLTELQAVQSESQQLKTQLGELQVTLILACLRRVRDE